MANSALEVYEKEKTMALQRISTTLQQILAELQQIRVQIASK